MKAIVFAGPSLPPAARPAFPGIEWRPPARQGDVYRAALERPAIIGVIDGVFEVVPTVWHKEILWAMAQGIHVYGAASTGALRAAELDAFGMVGMGRIYEDFRDGILEDDDEVALLHGPEETGYVPLTEPMVNVRATLHAAVERGELEGARASALAQAAKAIFYKERTWLRIEALLDAEGSHAAEGRIALARTRIDQKQRDARAMVEMLAGKMGPDLLPLVRCFQLSSTTAWLAFCCDTTTSPKRTAPLLRL